MSSPLETRWVAGAMTGTSMDGIDVALVRIDGTGLDLLATVVRHRWESLEDLADRLQRAAAGTPARAVEFAALALALGECHADAVANLLDGETLDLVAAHGQTIVHDPPHSWQLLDPAPIARRLGCRVVNDLRQADLAAGGEGAPITPLADWILFRHPERRRAVVNLGGFCNVTILPAAAALEAPEALARIRGFDVCACNQVLDGITRLAFDQPFDADGAGARAGTVQPALAADLRRELEDQRDEQRSLGSGDELALWVRDRVKDHVTDDLLASAVDAIAACLAGALAQAGDVDEILLAGGGVRNAALLDAIAARTGRVVTKPGEGASRALVARESAAMAVLGALCADRVPITLPQVTGCEAPAPVAGRWCEPP